MPSCTRPVAGARVYGFVNCRHFDSSRARLKNRDGKQLTFSMIVEVSERTLCITRAMNTEDRGNLENGIKVGIQDFGNGDSFLGQSARANSCSKLEKFDRGENGLVIAATHSRSNLLKVAVDIDEVLGSFLNSLNTFLAEKYLVQYDLSEYYVYDFMKIWKCSQAEANHRVHAFFESKHFNSGILPIRDAYQSLRRLSSYCNLVVVTSRQHVIREPSLEWIATHYTGLFSEVHFGNHFALEGKARPKSEICKSLGVQILIDDNPRYAVECAKQGIEVLLFDLDCSYPWSKTPDGPSHPLIKRVCNWQEVEIKLKALRSLYCEYS